MDNSLLWPAACVFFGTSGLVFTALYLLQRPDGRIEDRVRELVSTRSGDVLKGPSTPSGWTRLVDSLSSWIPQSKHGQLEQRLLHAGCLGPSAVTMYVTAQYVCASLLAAAAGLACLRLGTRSLDLLLLVAVAGCLGFLLPAFWLRQRKATRQRLFLRSLPDFLDLLVACVEAGLSLEGAIQRISRELDTAHPALAAEIQRVQREMELGTPTDRALQNLAERTDLDPLRTIASACNQARRFGTRLAGALRVQADMLRSHREEAAEETAQKAAVKILMPTLLLLFPATFVVLAGPAAIQIYESFQTESLSGQP